MGKSNESKKIKNKIKNARAEAEKDVFFSQFLFFTIYRKNHFPSQKVQSSIFKKMKTRVLTTKNTFGSWGGGATHFLATTLTLRKL